MSDTNLTPEEREVLKKDFNLTDAELDEQIAKINSGDTDNSIPQPNNKDDILKFLRDVFNIKEEHLKMNRTGNLTPEELGRLTLPVRGYNDIANYTESEGLGRVTSYLRGKSSNIITTSTSKKGFFLNLTTTIRQVKKNIGSKVVHKESSLLGGTKETVEGGEEE